MDRDRNQIRRILSTTKGYLFVSLFTVCLYSFFQNFDKISAIVDSVIDVLEPLFWGIGIAFVINMPMRLLENRVFRKWRSSALKRCVCMALGALFVLMIFSLVMLMLVPRFVESAEVIIRNFDSYIVSLDNFSVQMINRFNMTASDIKGLESTLQSIFDYIDEMFGRIVPTVLKLTVSLASILVDLLLALILSFYALFNKERHIEQAKRLVHALFSDERRDRIFDVCTRTNQALNNYFCGMILECGILGSMCFIGMKIFGFPYALLISVIVGVTQIVPVIGPWFSAILGALIILMVEPVMALWFLVFIVVVQQIECNLIYPRVVGNMVGLSGIWVMIAVLLGGGLFGIPGVILCVPVMAVLQTLIREWVDARIAWKEGRRQVNVSPEQVVMISEASTTGEAQESAGEERTQAENAPEKSTAAARPAESAESETAQPQARDQKAAAARRGALEKKRKKRR